MSSYWKSSPGDRRGEHHHSGLPSTRELNPQAIEKASQMGQLYTRTGSPVQILTTERRHPHYPIVGLARIEIGGPEEVLTFTRAGHYSANGSEGEFDLIVKERKRVFYVGLQQQAEGAVISTDMHNSKEALFAADQPHFDAIAKVTWES